MKKLLILGSDFATYDLVLQAKKMGVYVIVTDLMETSPSKRAADEAWKISTTDIDLLEAKIKENNINGVLAGASEFNLENVRELCKRLDLPCYCGNDNAWGVARNKGVFKKLCKECGVPVATDYKLTDDLTDEELDAVKFPVVVKPVDKSGNRGMTYCNNKEELIEGYKYARSVSDNTDIVVERRLHGPQFTAYYNISNGEAKLSFYTSAHSEKGELENLYSLEAITACNLKQYMEEVDEGTRKVLKKAGCDEGIAWVEFIHDEDGTFYSLEMGFRFAGTVVYPAHEKLTGFNTFKWMIEYALGIEHSLADVPQEVPAYKECGASYDLFTNKEGVIKEIIGLEEIEKIPGVCIDMPKRAGDKVIYHANMGVVRIYAKSCDELISIIEKINNTLYIKDENGDNMFINFKDVESVRIENEAGLKEFGLN